MTFQSLLNLPNGARFYKCALQVNPYHYVQSEQKPTPFENETDYNRAMVEAMAAAGIAAIAVTDHQNVKSSITLSNAAREAGIHAFNGFELESKDGIHFLALFDASKDINVLDRILGSCGIVDGDRARNNPCDLESHALLSTIRQHEGVAIAPHAIMKKGLLYAGGRSRAALWRDTNLEAVGIHCPVVDIDAKYRDIISNVDPAYDRPRPVAILHCNDVWSPEQFKLPESTSLIKMSAFSLAALRQAFLDPESRVLLSSDVPPEREWNSSV
ncbi:MAG TPA: PHP domain-containing protein [Candidatus Tumulicola sp.]|jgi:PHP family Zn ribbon phosphoesterase